VRLLGKRKSDTTRRQPRVNPPTNRGAVFSYHANRTRSDGELRRPAPEATNTVIQRNRAVRRRRWLRQIPTVAAIIVIILSIGYGFTLDMHPSVIAASAPITNQVFLRDKADYQSRAQQILQQDFSSRFKLTINTNKIAHELRRSFPELSDVSITLPLVGRRPIIIVDATNPALIATSQNNAYVVDTRGMVIMKTTEASDVVKGLPVVNDESGLPAEVGKAVLPAENVHYITSVIGQFNAAKLSVQSITLPHGGAHELHVRLKDTPYLIKFNLGTDSRIATGTFLATKQKLDATHIKPVEYIDVRLEERAYYK
jgi:hypothetical protein